MCRVAKPRWTHGRADSLLDDVNTKKHDIKGDCMKIVMSKRGMASLALALAAVVALSACAADSSKLESLKNMPAGVLVRELFVSRGGIYHVSFVSKDGMHLASPDGTRHVDVNPNDVKVKEVIDQIALEVDRIKSAEDGKTATEGIGKIEILLKQYQEATKVSEVDAMISYASLLYRLAEALPSPLVRKALRTKFASVVKKAKNGELELLEEWEEFLLLPDWLQNPGVGISEPPHSFFMATQDVDGKALEAMRKSSFAQFELMLHSAYGITRLAYKLSAAATPAEARKIIASLDGEFAKHEKLQTANIGKYSYTKEEACERKTACAKSYLNLLAMVSANASEAVKPVVEKRMEKQRQKIESLEMSAQTLN